MKKILLGLFIIFGLSACDDVDITKYPEKIQNCYNTIIYNQNNCTKSKKTIIKYCECYNAVLEKDTADLRNIRGNGMFAWVIKGTMDMIAEKTANSCAEKTGYTRIANCKKK